MSPLFTSLVFLCIAMAHVSTLLWPALWLPWQSQSPPCAAFVPFMLLALSPPSLDCLPALPSTSSPQKLRYLGAFPVRARPSSCLASPLCVLHLQRARIKWAAVGQGLCAWQVGTPRSSHALQQKAGIALWVLEMMRSLQVRVSLPQPRRIDSPHSSEPSTTHSSPPDLSICSHIPHVRSQHMR